jgi:mannose-1-phosphate guanylyltransferase/phosphomannomutase
MKAVIMAGGEGTRLRPLTARRPKPLAPVMNLPIMEHSVNLLRQHGITDILFTLYYMADEIEGYFGDGSRWGVKFQSAIQDTPLGTAGGLMLKKEFLSDETFIIISGDALTDLDITRALQFHRDRQSEATLVLSQVPNPLEFGVVITDEVGRIRRFLEKPSWGEVFSDTVNTGMYILEPSVLERMELGQNYDWSQDIFPAMLAEGRSIHGYIMDGYWCDVGNLNQYREAQYAALDGRVKMQVPGVKVGDVWTGSGCRISPSAVIDGPVLIGNNVTIKDGARVGPSSVIGDNTIIEEGARVVRSVLWENNYIGANTLVSGATVCSSCVIKRDSEVQEGAAIGEKCRIDRESTVRSNIKLWPDKVVEAGSTVTMSLVWGNKWSGALFRDLGVAGIANIEINPEFASKLGAAFGATLKPGSNVMVARDSGLASRMVKRAMVAGLMSVGCNVVNLRSTPLPVMRFSLNRSRSAAGGVYVRLAPDNPRALMIEIFDANGVYLSRASERKVESVFYREDYARADAEQIGSLEYGVRNLEVYNDTLVGQLRSEEDDEPLTQKVVADFSFSRVANVNAEAYGRMGLDVTSLNAFTDPRKTPRKVEDRAGILSNLASIVTALRADVGVMFENDGERFCAVDHTGAVIEGEKLLLLMVALVGRTVKPAAIAVPVSAPSCVENIAALHGAAVVRTKTDVRSLMAAASKQAGGDVHLAADASGGFIFPGFTTSFDAIYSFGKLLKMLKEQGLNLHEFVAELPETTTEMAEIRCPWDAKGVIMRSLIEEAEQAGQVELIDGVKVIDAGGWTLVVPHSSDPCIHVYAEAGTREASKARVAATSERICALRDQARR